MKAIAAAFGFMAMLFLNVVWSLIFKEAPFFLIESLQWGYTASHFFLGMLGGYWFRGHMWYVFIGVFCVAHLSIESTVQSDALLGAIVLKKSLLFSSCVVFGGIIYMLLFGENPSNNGKR
ncbi:MAG: hypothetical protein ACE3JP_08570 [Ectobacillus sp.]